MHKNVTKKCLMKVKIRSAPHELFLKKVFLINFYVAGRFIKIKQLAGKIW